MNRLKAINLNFIALTHREEIDRVAEGIWGDADSTLWTGELRATVRGGKPCGQAPTDENDSNK